METRSSRGAAAAAAAPLFVSLLLLPCIIIFDVIGYFLQRSACLTCGNIPSYIQQSSLAAHILQQFFLQMQVGRKKEKKEIQK